jgi:transketolase
MVIDMHTIKPLDKDTIIKAAKITGKIVTVEEHSIYGGLGGAVAEVVAQHYPVKMKILGIPDENAIHAKSQEIFEYYGLTSTNIVKETKKLLKI